MVKKIIYGFLALVFTVTMSSCDTYIAETLHRGVIASFIKFENSDTTNMIQDQFAVTMIKQNERIELPEEEVVELVDIIEKTLYQNPGRKNCPPSRDDIIKCKKDGIAIIVKYNNEKELSIGLPEGRTKVKQIWVLLGEWYNYVEYISEESSGVYALATDSVDTIESYFNN